MLASWIFKPLWTTSNWFSFLIIVVGYSVYYTNGKLLIGSFSSIRKLVMVWWFICLFTPHFHFTELNTTESILISWSYCNTCWFFGFPILSVLVRQYLFMHCRPKSLRDTAKKRLPSLYRIALMHRIILYLDNQIDSVWPYTSSTNAATRIGAREPHGRNDPY